MDIKFTISRIISRCVTQPLYRQMRGMTLGTRSLIINKTQEIMLIQHSYAKGWALPGGGVERGESIFQSAMREIREEAGIVALSPPVLRGICLNDRQFPGDHVAIFLFEAFTREDWQPGLEIRAAAFFPLNDLPEGTTPGTRRRIQEFLVNAPVAECW